MSHTVFLIRGKFRFYYTIESRNGRILTVSQKYWSKGNAKRAAKKMAHDLKAKYIPYE